MVELYAGTAAQFAEDVELNRLVAKLEDAWLAHYGRRAPDGEVRAWRNSLRAFKDVLRLARFDSQGVLVEYRLPMSSKRIDCLVTGLSPLRRESATIVELKQWEETRPADGESVVTFLGGGNRLALHPSVQADHYRLYLLESHTAFYGDDAIDLHSCTYLHNYALRPQDTLLAERFKAALEQTPLFDGRAVERLRDFLVGTVGGGQGLRALRRVQQSSYRPSKALMAHVSRIIRRQERYILLDEQQIAYETVQAVLRSLPAGRQAVVVVEGGPGTGKSAVALQLLADALAEGRPAHYATGSRAFNETLWEILGPTSRQVVRYFHQYGTAPPGSLDLLILDEAHRIRATSNHRFMAPAQRSGKSQVRELLEAARVCVVFLDPAQVVRPDEVGSVETILAEAARQGADTRVLSLDAQFRCAGSEAYVDWVDNTLGVRRTGQALWEGDDGFDVRIVASPEELEAAIREKAAQGFTARMMAGYCWPWSKDLDEKGDLRLDVQVGGWRRPWNARPELTGLKPGIPRSHHWAYDPGGIGQVGCIYTAQGFDFDYAGVLWGRDLRYDWDQMEWVGDRTQSFDTAVKRNAERFLANVKNTYRVLLTRAMKGCLIHFVDKGTERFVRSRMAHGKTPSSPASQP
jgi:DUF2075 family protein